VDLQNGILTVTDANSRNGVTIGQNKIFPGAPTSVSVGDVIKIGRAEIVIVDFSGGSVAAAQTELLGGATEFLPSSGAHTEVFVAPTPPPVPSLAQMLNADADMEVICGQYGATNKGGNKFCNKCGGTLAAPTPPPTPEPAAGLKPICNKCGAPNTKVGNFCAGCGNSLVQ